MKKLDESDGVNVEKLVMVVKLRYFGDEKNCEGLLMKRMCGIDGVVVTNRKFQEDHKNKKWSHEGMMTKVKEEERNSIKDFKTKRAFTKSPTERNWQNLGTGPRDRERLKPRLIVKFRIPPTVKLVPDEMVDWTPPPSEIPDHTPICTTPQFSYTE
ncbi:hypothetical protein Pmani_023128 [Petrolisthes manimaculis]|uniref:Uncharacterized protein n=1 Tax=Petrolisthes manimaculis TaxID=1843537 RepID=A0AAE1PCI3_9EUCA|nr:hypothetical protein Pmani_023128 [Petrolisthes manimaculis]